MSKYYDEDDYRKQKRKRHENNKRQENNDQHDDSEVLQEGIQKSVIEQESDELVWIRNSCNVDVQTTDTQAAVSLQVGLQLAVALVISIAIGDSDEGQTVTQDLFQQFDTEQTNKQKILVENSKDFCSVETN